MLFFSCSPTEHKTSYSSSTNPVSNEQTVKIDRIKTADKPRSERSLESDSLLKHPKFDTDSDARPYYHLSKEMIDTNVYYTDTVVVKTSQELIEEIKSNRLIKLVDQNYILKRPLLIDSVKNLKIVGTDASKIAVYEKNINVLKLSNTHNIHLDNLILGHSKESKYEEEQGVLKIDYSYNIKISNCIINGFGTYGLATYAVYDLAFIDSEITACNIFIFELERSRKVQFQNAKFHDNILSTSVLGGISDASKEVVFLNCEFSNNRPKMIGNPAFNQRDVYEPVLFANCEFKDNQGFKWYGDYIELNNCDMTSSGFIGL